MDVPVGEAKRMADEKELSPEEKLLRVIQSGKKGGTAPSSGPAAALKLKPPPEPAVKPPESATVSSHGGLLVDDLSEASSESRGAGGAIATLLPSRPGDDTDAGASPKIRKLRRDDDPVIRRVNLLLVVAAALIVVLIGVQIGAHVTMKPLPEARPGDPMLPKEPTNAVPAPVEDYIKLFDQRPWFPSVGKAGNTTNDVSAVDPIELLRQSVRLVAVSEVSEGLWEAIIVDSATGRMHFLRPGGRMLAGEKGKEREWVLVRAARDSAVLTDGRDEVVLK